MESKGGTATVPRGRNALAFPYQSKHLMGLSGCLGFFSPMLAFVYFFCMRRLALVLLEWDYTLRFSVYAFVGLKLKKHASVGEFQSDGGEKPGSAEWLCMASLVFKIPSLDLLMRRSYQHTT